MGFSRRQLLQGAGALALWVSAPVRWVAGAWAAPAKTATAPSWYSRASFVPLVGTQFSVSTTATSVAPLTLVEISDLTPTPGKKGSSDGRFSLLFTGAARFAQDTYPIRNDTLGNSNLFVVPVGSQNGGARYEVIVNRLT